MFVSRIKSIKKVGTFNTYDLNTPKYENFILDNGILSHNSGKTYHAIAFALEIAKALEVNFTVEKNISFNFTDMLKKSMLPDNDGPGTIFLMEEVGAVGSGSAARQWQSQANLFFNSFLQTSRHRRHILLLTTPNFSYLEKSSRQLVHCQLIMKGIDFNKETSFSKPFLLSTNPTTGKIYAKYPRVKLDGVKYKFKVMELKKPPKDFIEAYEKEKLKYTTELNRMIINATAQAQSVTKRINPLAVQKLKEEGFKQVEIAKKLNVHVRTVRNYLEKAKKIIKMGNIPKETGDTSIEREKLSCVT